MITGENFKRINGGAKIKELKEKIYKLQEQCRELYYECRDTGNFDSVKHVKLAKRIDWLEYLLWGETK